jgi:hypothetical protein
MWHKAQAQLSRGVAALPHDLGRPAMCWHISKNHFHHMTKEVVKRGIQCEKATARRKLGRPAKLHGRPGYQVGPMHLIFGHNTALLLL